MAESRRDQEPRTRGDGKFREVSEKGITEITWDESDIQITAEDLDWDYVKMLPELLR